MDEQNPCLPDFIGIGAQKAGTTWLGHNLQLHPDVWMPRNRELHYFDDRINEPKNPISRLYGKMTGKGHVHRRWRRQVRGRLRSHSNRLPGQDLLWDLRYYTGAPGDRWYASLFEPGRGKMKGEITPAYSTLRLDDVAYVHDLVPEAKIIFMMRNPIERAWSQFVMRLDRSGKRFRPHPAQQTPSKRREGRITVEDGLPAGAGELGRVLPGGADFRGLPRRHPLLSGGAPWQRVAVARRRRLLQAARCRREGPRQVGWPHDVGRRSRSGRPLREELSRLSEHFGGYASFWFYCAEKLAGDPPEGEYVPYPLWESAIWGEWIQKTVGNPGYQSGLLPAVKTAV
jgi:Sulfotransferase family